MNSLLSFCRIIRQRKTLSGRPTTTPPVGVVIITMTRLRFRQSRGTISDVKPPWQEKKFGEFYAEKRVNYVCYQKDGCLIVEELKRETSSRRG